MGTGVPMRYPPSSNSKFPVTYELAVILTRIRYFTGIHDTTPQGGTNTAPFEWSATERSLSRKAHGDTISHLEIVRLRVQQSAYSGTVTGTGAGADTDTGSVFGIGTCNCGIGRAEKRAWQGLAMSRAQRTAFCWRPFFVAMPALPYI